MKKAVYLIVFALFLMVSSNGYSQFKDYGIKGGLQFNGLMPFSEFDSKFSFIGRGFVDFELSKTLALELGAGYGQFVTEDNFNAQGTAVVDQDKEVKANLIPIDARLKITPWSSTKTSWNPYFYVGAGLLNFDVTETPDVTVSPQYNELESGWTGFIPVGIGTEIKMSKNVLLDIHVGASYTFTDLLNNFVIEDYNDSWLQGGVGIAFAGGEDCTIDTDKDGLTDCVEEKGCTNPAIADTDGDGLNDGSEVNTYKTDACNKDTDADGLIDGMEVNTYNTNPLKTDTDADGLTDSDEVNNYRTDPLDSDSDNDELMDGAEVKTHKTNPLNPDTDAGSVFDGIEVARGTDPLNPADDVPEVKKEEPIKVGQVITLEGINFATNSAEISSLAEDKLERALNALKEYPDLEVEISGHTDNTGGRAHNMRLSERRAESVKDWFVSKGIDASRITTTGYGPDQPIDTNDTEEGRFKNRRIDFKRTK
jgi:outer membrane protein OmpA-like peptidoglycan-associated protein